jgi:hypothetical protein
MSENTLVLIHIPDEHRIITGFANRLPASGLVASDKSKFMLKGQIYDVLDVMDNLGEIYDAYDPMDRFGDTPSHSSGQRLLDVLTKMTGNQQSAVALLEAAEPLLGRPQNIVSVNRADDGTISLSAVLDYFEFTIVRARKSRGDTQGQQLAATADALIAAKPNSPLRTRSRRWIRFPGIRNVGN